MVNRRLNLIAKNHLLEKPMARGEIRRKREICRMLLFR
jgi:hypothetical protein